MKIILGMAAWSVRAGASDEEGFAAAAAALLVGIVEDEARAQLLLDEVELGPGQVLKIRVDITAARAGSLVGRAGYEREALFFRDGAAATALYTEFVEAGHGELDYSAIIKLIREA